MPLPRASVCIASYKHERYLPATLDGILAQTMADLEVIVVDDGSPDNSLAVARGYAERDARVKVLQHPNGVNRGISPTVNLALSHARGTFVAWTGSDDVWYPHCLQRLVDELEKHRDASFAHGRADLIDGDGKRIGTKRLGFDIAGTDDQLESLVHWNPVMASAALMRGDRLREVGGLDDALIYSDWELWMRLLTRGPARFVDESIGQYRVHGNNISVGIRAATELQRQRAVIDTRRTAWETDAPSRVTPRVRASLRLQSALFSFLLEEDATADAHVEAARAVAPEVMADPAWLAGWLTRASDQFLMIDFLKPGRPLFGTWLIERLGNPPVLRRVLCRAMRRIERGLRVRTLVLDGRRAAAGVAAVGGALAHQTYLTDRRYRRTLVKALLGRA